MSKPRVYLSFPAALPNRDKEIEEIVKNVGGSASIYAWTSSLNYSDKPVRECDIFVFCFADFSFKGPASKLPSGVMKELGIAHSLGKKIYLAYKTSNGYTGIYEVAISFLANSINGIAATSHKFWDSIIPKTSMEEPAEDTSGVKQYPLTPEECFNKALPSVLLLLKRRK